MIDRENVVKELESLRDICNAKSNMATGNGKVAWAGYANAADDALALLKEQEIIEPIDLGLSADFVTWGCPICERWLDHDYKYCPYCGKEVKWDD